MFELSHPFFRPIWLRMLAFAWALRRLVGGDPGWAIIVGGMGVAVPWGLFFAHDRDRSPTEGAK